MRRRPAAILLLPPFLLLAACAAPSPRSAQAPQTTQAPAAPAARGPNTQTVLLADPDGRVGRVSVSNAAGSTTLDRENTATGVTDAGTAPTPPAAMDAGAIKAHFGAALEAQPAAPLHFTLYFEQASTELTEQSRREFPAVVAAVRERASVDTSVVGHSDTAGDAKKNLELSLRRAMAVGGLLAAEGIAPGSLEITSHGEANPLVPTPDGVPEPRNRRVEVTVR